MFIIIAWNGYYEGMYLVCTDPDEVGVDDVDVALFKTRKEANNYAKEVCSFDYKIVEL